MLPADTLEARLVRLSQSPRLRAQIFAELHYGEVEFPLRAFSWGDSTLPAVLIVAGVHGDEPGGIEAALRLLEALDTGANPLSHHCLIVIPCLNLSGLADGTRGNRAGQDINRQFHSDGTQESAAIRRFLDPSKAAALVDLHIDTYAQGYYLFELRRDELPSLASLILDALTGVGFPLEEHPFFAGHVGARGLFAPNAEQLAEFGRSVQGQSLAEWAWDKGIPRAYAMESPYRDSFERSAAMHVTALFALFAALET